MKKLLLSLFVLSVFAIGANQLIYAQQDTTGSVDTAAAAPAQPVAEEEAEPAEEEGAATQAPEQQLKGHQMIKKYFIEGDVVWMTPILIVLILGLALVIERIISLNLSTVNTKKLLNSIESQLSSGNVEGAKELCKSNRGPVASIFYQGLSRVSEGIEIVEKSIVSFGSVQMGLLERGLVWISLFIALAPMLGFLGTVIGMIQAFDAIEAAGDISPSLVAGGIKVALLTTVFGLIVAIILQLFYNYIVNKIDGLVHDMEDASISFVDLLVKYKVTK